MKTIYSKILVQINYKQRNQKYRLKTRLICLIVAAVTWVEYCRNGVKPQKINQSINKKCFRNVYAPLGAKFRFIFSVEAKPVQSK